MSAGDAVVRPHGRLPGAFWWLVLALTVGVFIRFGPIAAGGVLAFLLIQRARPFDFVISYLILVAGASVVNYEAGRLTYEISLLMIALVFMLYCYTLHVAPRFLRFAATPLTRPMILFGALTFINYARGLVVGNSLRFANLELLAVLSLGCVFLVATARIDRAAIVATMTMLFVFGCIHLGLGMWGYQTVGTRSGGIYFTPFDGVIVSFALPFVLREPDTRRRWIYLFSLTPMLVHQFLSYTRGFWLAIMATTVLSVVMYGGRGPGAGARWRRAGALFAGFAVVGAFGAWIVAAALGLGNLAGSAAERLASSGSVEMGRTTVSNIARLAEYMYVIDDIRKAPIFGYGLGHTYWMTEVIYNLRLEHWFTHNNYLLVWLKQGIIGLGLFIWVLIAAFVTGWRGRNHPDPYLAAWCCGAAAVALHYLIYCNVHFPLSNIDTTFLAALIWGGAMSITAKDVWILRWKVPQAEAGKPDS